MIFRTFGVTREDTTCSSRCRANQPASRACRFEAVHLNAGNLAARRRPCAPGSADLDLHRSKGRCHGRVVIRGRIVTFRSHHDSSIPSGPILEVRYRTACRTRHHASDAMTLDTCADLSEYNPDDISDRMNFIRSKPIVGFRGGQTPHRKSPVISEITGALFWWHVRDSNPRMRSSLIYSQIPLATWVTCRGTPGCV